MGRKKKRMNCDCRKYLCPIRDLIQSSALIGTINCGLFFKKFVCLFISMKYYLFEVVKFEKRKEVLVPYYERFNPDNLFHWNDKLFKKFVSMKHDPQSKSSN